MRQRSGSGDGKRLLKKTTKNKWRECDTGSGREKRRRKGEGVRAIKRVGERCSEMKALKQETLYVEDTQMLRAAHCLTYSSNSSFMLLINSCRLSVCIHLSSYQSFGLILPQTYSLLFFPPSRFEIWISSKTSSRDSMDPII